LYHRAKQGRKSAQKYTLKIGRCNIMKKIYFSIITLLLTGLFLSGCATVPPFSTQPAFSPQKINVDAYEPKIDNFIVILDASASMRTLHDGSSRLETAKAIVSRMNRTIPDLDLQAGLRTFGHSRAVSTEMSALMYGLAGYTPSGLQMGLDKVTKADGSSPLSNAIDGVHEDLRGTSGKTAVIIVSDGEDMDERPVKAAMRLKEAYADRLCIYTIAVGSSPADKRFLNELSQIGECGYATSAEKIASGQAMSGFVEDVFLAKKMDDDHDGVTNDKDRCPDTPQGVAVDMNGCALDSDGDGIADYLDKCPGTPQGVAVDMNGCALDADADGVADYLDKCPGTPQGIIVDANGCPYDSDGDGVANYMDQCPETSPGVSVDTKGCSLDADADGVPDYRDACPDTPAGETVDAKGCSVPKATQSAMVTETGTWLYEDIKFDSGSSNIKSGSYPVLAEIILVLNQNPNLKVEVQGHTDSAGSLALNNKLSGDRANAVMTYLTDKGVNPDQLSAAGYGPSRPLVSNDTAEGRARNRRVELKPLQ
jgi:OmpA-OmpF porin, OOP family